LKGSPATYNVVIHVSHRQRRHTKLFIDRVIAAEGQNQLASKKIKPALTGPRLPNCEQLSRLLQRRSPL